MKNPFRWKALTASPTVVEAVQDRRTNFYVKLGGSNQQVNAAFQRGQQASYGWMYSNRPAVRTVVDYVARNVAQLGLKLYERVDDTERERREGHPAAQTLDNPDGRTPHDQFIFRMVADWLVYDNAYVLKFRPDVGDKLTLVRLPPAQVTVQGGRFTAELYRVYRHDGTHFDVQPEDLIHWHGYNPDDPLLGISKLETLRETLTEDQVSQTTTVELMRSGLRGGHIERPLDAPEWSEEARQRFQEGWRNQKKAALKGDPVLEEGMKYVQDSITPKDAELLAGRKFTVEEVARVYGVPPGVFGLEPSTDLEEQRKQVYTDVLPPITEALACQLDVDILQREYDEYDYYFEFDLNEKLRGDPVARFQAITAATGAPWLLRNEARALENRPPIEGGDEIITPLNVIAGDNPKPAPNVMGPQDPNQPPQDGSHREEPKSLTSGTKALEVSVRAPRRTADLERQHRYVDEAQGLFERYYARMARSLRGKSVKFDRGRWDKELSDDLFKLMTSIVEREGGIYVARLAGADFDTRKVVNYLKATSEGAAEAINDVTAKDLEKWDVEDAISRARGERSAVAGASIGARAAIFARYEAAKQAPTPELRMKTWIADTQRHQEFNGETVPLGESFSAGFEPGSAPNCRCSLSIE